MNSVLPFFLLPLALIVSADHSHEDVGEYGNYNTWRKAVCEKNDQEMLKEMEECFQKEHKNVQDATSECAVEAFPDSGGKTISFVNAACKNMEIFKKFDTCFEEYEANAAFRDQMEIEPEVEACYDKVHAKYKMDKVRKLFKDWPFAEKKQNATISKECYVKIFEKYDLENILEFVEELVAEK